ncbi:hypothetical protein DY000_02027585 [Brassica cretica]|uniref:Choline monooxygenase, chloroplastic n=1 Tax=Brassica cretica TaxID=69181 RepID=A0ABQ7E4F5_BRACR|nr:hypothetical protein DY000_02027585 [Brassica cretica]
MMTMLATITPPSSTLKSTTTGYLKLHLKFSVSVSQSARRRCLDQSLFCTRDPISSSSRVVAAASNTSNLVEEFDPEIPVERALTPPSSWYTDHQFHRDELDRVFYGGWQVVGLGRWSLWCAEMMMGRLMLSIMYALTMHLSWLLEVGESLALFALITDGLYSLNGSLVKATRTTGIENSALNEMGLKPLRVAVWGPFVLLKVTQATWKKEEDVESDGLVASEWLGSSVGRLSEGGVDSPLSFICRHLRKLMIPYAHKGLMSGLDLETYSTTLFERVSIQECGGGGSKAGEEDGGFDRLGSQALYAFVYPNFMINRYGPWMDTNLVIPLGPRKCKVVFDYFLDPSLKVDDEAFIRRSLEESERVQMEDAVLCENVQRGLESPAYDKGRYALVEKAMHHFHCLLHRNLKI